MRVKSGVCVISRAKAFNGDRFDNVRFGKKLDRVIDRGLGKRRIAFGKCRIDFIDCGMCAVGIKIIVYLQPQRRRFYTFCRHEFSGIHRELLANLIVINSLL